jgi:16S rRNA (guanine527-N7)-methyltransferase
MTTSKDLNRIARWLEMEWSEEQRASFTRFEAWLVDEAIPVGGLGPREASRVFDRHIADSLAFVRSIDDVAGTLADIGSGVGLPGIPIAIARPDMVVTIFDRAEGRTRQAARACRILGLDNVVVVTSDAGDVEETFDVVTFRASLPITQATGVFRSLARDGGIGLFALSRTHAPIASPEPPEGTIFTVVCEGLGVLDSPAWILRMQRSQST